MVRPEDAIRGDIYYKQMNYEAALTIQENRIAKAVSDGDVKGVVLSVTALVYMLPKKRRKATLQYMKDKNLRYDDFAPDNQPKYYDLWTFCNDQLQAAKLIFREGKGPGEYGTM